MILKGASGDQGSPQEGCTSIHCKVAWSVSSCLDCIASKCTFEHSIVGLTKRRKGCVFRKHTSKAVHTAEALIWRKTAIDGESIHNTSTEHGITGCIAFRLPNITYRAWHHKLHCVLPPRHYEAWHHILHYVLLPLCAPTRG
jgi:hypothetical protein